MASKYCYNIVQYSVEIRSRVSLCIASHRVNVIFLSRGKPSYTFLAICCTGYRLYYGKCNMKPQDGRQR